MEGFSPFLLDSVPQNCKNKNKSKTQLVKNQQNLTGSQSENQERYSFTNKCPLQRLLLIQRVSFILYPFLLVQLMSCPWPLLFQLATSEVILP